MSAITRRRVLTAGIAGGAVALAGCSDPKGYTAGKHPRASKVLDAMEGFRKEIPPDTRKVFAGTGMSVKGLEPYTMPHLDQVADGLGVTTRKECLMLLTYLKDSDLKLRYIAVRAIDNATNAYPNGLSVECFTDTGSEAHRKMLFRFLEVIDALPA